MDTKKPTIKQENDNEQAELRQPDPKYRDPKRPGAIPVGNGEYKTPDEITEDRLIEVLKRRLENK